MNYCAAPCCTEDEDIWDNEMNHHLFTPARQAEAMMNLQGYFLDRIQWLSERIDQLEVEAKRGRRT